MCWQDIEIGMLTQASEYHVTLSTTKAQILPVDPNRVALIFSSPSSGTAFVCFDPDEAAGEGLILPANFPPIRMVYPWEGDLIRRAWYGSASAGTPTLVIHCVSLPKPLGQLLHERTQQRDSIY